MKRSHAVVAVLTAATVGTGAYAMMRPERCAPAVGGAAADPSGTACRSSGSSGTGGWHGSHSIWGSSGSGSSTAAPSAATARGGFGSTAHAMGGSSGGT